MSEVTRTDQVERHPEWVMGGNPQAILAQEARGGREALLAEVLPVRGDWAAVEALGVVAGEVVTGDPLFRHVILPDGWCKETGEDPRFIDIYDETGRRVVQVFYKAAFYDRKADFVVLV